MDWMNVAARLLLVFMCGELRQPVSSESHAECTLHMRTRRQWNIVWLALTFSKEPEIGQLEQLVKWSPAQHDRVRLCICVREYVSWTRQKCKWEKRIYQSQPNWFYVSRHAAPLIANPCVIKSKVWWRQISKFRWMKFFTPCIILVSDVQVVCCL